VDYVAILCHSKKLKFCKKDTYTMRKTLLLALMLLLIVVPALAQEEETLPDFITHTECEVDLTGETITIYHLGDVSGSYAPITQPLLAGLADAITYYNARGGVCGAELAQQNFDTGGDPAQTQAGYDQLSGQEDKPDLLVLYASGDSELLRTQLAEDEIPVLISAGSLPGLYGENADEPGWVFATNPLYADQFASFCQFVGANPEEFPEPVIGYMGWGGPVASFGMAAFTPEATAYCESQGVEVLDTAESFLPTSTDVSTNVQNLTDAGANIIYVNALATGPVTVAQAIHFLGIQDEVKLASVNWGMDSSAALLARDRLGENGLPILNGMYGSVPFQWWTERTQPGIQLITEQADANERQQQVRNISYLLGWATVDTYVEMYAQAVNEAGSLDAVDGALMKTVIENLEYNPLGLYDINFEGGAIRALPNNRIMQLFFANATMDGIASSGDDALKIEVGDGTNYYPPVYVQRAPEEGFAPAPDTRPGMMDAEEAATEEAGS
jgi:ABC-type branched-subunit amino acid transport system substrate-binding protein